MEPLMSVATNLFSECSFYDCDMARTLLLLLQDHRKVVELF